MSPNSNQLIGIVLAAGHGLRLRPSTERCPKPLIPVGGVEPLFFALYKLYRAGVRKAVINTHYLSDRVLEAVARWRALFVDFEIRTTLESPQILGTGGSILHIIQSFPDWFNDCDGLLLQNGDTLAEFDFGPLIKDPTVSSFAVSFRDDHLKKYNPLWLTQAGYWAGIGKESPEAGLVPAHFLGVHFLSKTAVDYLADFNNFQIREVDLFNGIYRPITDLGLRIKSQTYFKDSDQDANEFWFDMTTQQFLLEAQKHVLESLLKTNQWSEVLKVRFPQISELSPGVWALKEAAKNHNFIFRAPAVFVENPNESRKILCRALTLGPHASFIHEWGPCDPVASDQTNIEIVNSVVFTGNSPKSEDATFKSGKVSDAICVL